MSSIENLAEVITEEDIYNEYFENRELDSQTLEEKIEETSEEKESNEVISTTRAEEVLFENDPSYELNLPNILQEDRFNDESNEHESTTSSLKEDFTSKEKSPEIYSEVNQPEDQDSSYQAFNKAKSMWEDFNHSEHNSSPKNVVDSPISSQLNHQSPTTSSIMKNIFPLKSYSSSYRKSDPSYFENETPVIFQRLYESASIAKVKREKLTEYYVRQEAEEIEKSKFRIPDSSPLSVNNLKKSENITGENYGEYLYQKSLIWSNNLNQRLEIERKRNAEKLKKEEDSFITYKPQVIPPPPSISAKIEKDEKEGVYDHLYNQKEDHNKALNKEKKDFERRFHHDYPFHPEIYHKSVTLSAHSRKRRESIENMIRDETLGKPTPIKEKITRRASVWKTLEAGFPLYQPDSDSQSNKNESGLFKMLEEDRIRINEIIEEKQQSRESPSPIPVKFNILTSRKTDTHLSPESAVVNTQSPLFCAPSRVKSPIFHASEIKKEILPDKSTSIDYLKRKDGELSPETKLNLVKASSLLKEKVLFSSPSSKENKVGKSIFEHLYQDHFYRSVHSVKREIVAKKLFPHKPDIGVNKHVAVETNRKDFFQRLYSHADPSLGRKKRSVSAPPANRESQNPVRTRSISRKFSGDRRKEFDDAQKILLEHKSKNSHKNINDPPRPPWGVYGGAAKEKNKINPGHAPTPSDAKANPVFFNYIFCDPNESVLTTGSNNANRFFSPKRTGPLANIDIHHTSRQEQLKALADYYYNEKTGNKQNNPKIDESQEAARLARLEIELQKRKLNNDNRILKENMLAKQMINKKHSIPKSIGIMEDVKLKALSEIFDVLLLSVEYAKSVSTTTTTTTTTNENIAALTSGSSSSSSSSSEDISSRGLLDTSLAVPGMLKPKDLGDVISKIIDEYKPSPMSRETFIVAVTTLMASGKCLPLNSLLIAPSIGNCRSRSSLSYKTPRERQDESYQLNRPLNRFSRDVSERYLRGRNEFMRENNISHSNIIYAYDEIYKKKIVAKREELLKKEKSIYTFTPTFSTQKNQNYWTKQGNSRDKKIQKIYPRIPYKENVPFENNISNIQARVEKKIALQESEIWNNDASSIGAASSISINSNGQGDKKTNKKNNDLINMKSFDNDTLSITKSINSKSSINPNKMKNNNDSSHSPTRLSLSNQSSYAAMYEYRLRSSNLAINTST